MTCPIGVKTMHDRRIYNIVTSKSDPNNPDKKYWSQHGILMVGLTDNGEERITLKLNSLPIGEFSGWFSVYPKEEKNNRANSDEYDNNVPF